MFLALVPLGGRLYFRESFVSGDGGLEGFRKESTNLCSLHSIHIPAPSIQSPRSVSAALARAFEHPNNTGRHPGGEPHNTSGLH